MARKRNDAEHIGEYDYKDHKIMHTMEEEKRETLLLVAMKEFTKGYHAANTDEIVKEAGISKGLIFHYFGSKRGLYLFLIKYALDTVNEEYDKVILKSGDFLENIWEVTRTAIDLTFKYPILYSFLVRTYFSLDEASAPGSSDRYNPSEQLIIRIFKQSDESLFRDDIDIEKSQNIILWAMSGFTNRFRDYGNDIEKYQAHYDTIIHEFEEYLKILRKLFYKQI